MHDRADASADADAVGSLDGAAAQRLHARVERHLAAVYPDEDPVALGQRLLVAIGDPAQGTPAPAMPPQLWDQSDVWAISYPGSIVTPGQPPLRTLRRFLHEHLAGLVSGLHVLPFFPSSSDDGFAVTDYLAVDPTLGDWDDITELSRDVRVMADVVINHCSSAHPWFRNHCGDRDPGRGWFVEVDPATDLSAVVRPRTSPLLRPTATAHGQRHVWATFSHDQVDLDFANPEVLLEFVRTIRTYLDAGVSVVRLDAVAFLWKEPGTDCLNRPQTHELVRLLRALVEHRRPDAIIVTETNIPSQENLAYFGNANEAHVVYNFSLPPLLVQALVTGTSRHLTSWLMGMPHAQVGTALLNLIASHDGIGLRPTEGLLDPDELTALIATMESFGGTVSWRSLDDGGATPYEINIALIDALQGTVDGPDNHQLDRFACAHAIMLALEGIPAFYLHSLLGTTNDHERVATTGRARAINRHQWDLDELNSRLADPASLNARVLARLRHLITVRRQQPAFHPNATQFPMHLGEEFFALGRQSLDGLQDIFAINNVTDQVQLLPLSQVNLVHDQRWVDLLTGDELAARVGPMEVAPYQTLWLSNQP